MPNVEFRADDLKAVGEAFSRQHEDSFGYAMDPDTVEIVNLRLTTIGLRAKPEIAAEPPHGVVAEPVPSSRRRVIMDGRSIEIPVYQRASLGFGMAVDSPAIIEQPDSTTVLFPGCRASVDRFRNLIIELGEI